MRGGDAEGLPAVATVAQCQVTRARRAVRAVGGVVDAVARAPSRTASPSGSAPPDLQDARLRHVCTPTLNAGKLNGSSSIVWPRSQARLRGDTAGVSVSAAGILRA